MYEFEILESRLYVGKIKSSRFHTYHVVRVQMLMNQIQYYLLITN